MRNEIAELDLHALTVEEAIEGFVRFYNGRVTLGHKGPIDVIHGSTHGDRIKRRLQAFLAEHPDRLAFDRGEELSGNPGLTRVYPERALPTMPDVLGRQIVEFCAAPKTKDKITGKLRRYPYTQVAQAIENLVKGGQLKELKGAVTRYRST
ncbi:MAG: Smr/MutS family protein [Anaerolineae bacterium]